MLINDNWKYYVQERGALCLTKKALMKHNGSNKRSARREIPAWDESYGAGGRKMMRRRKRKRKLPLFGLVLLLVVVMGVTLLHF